MQELICYCQELLKFCVFSLLQWALIAWCFLGTALADRTIYLVKRDGKTVLSVHTFKNLMSKLELDKSTHETHFVAFYTYDFPSYQQLNVF
jgi:hypothetical protein